MPSGSTTLKNAVEGLLAALQGEHFADDGPQGTGVNPPGKLRKRRSVGLTGFAGMTSEDPVLHLRLSARTHGRLLLIGDSGEDADTFSRLAYDLHRSA